MRKRQVLAALAVVASAGTAGFTWHELLGRLATFEGAASGGSPA